ncbi:MAG TPA: hypothetical protein VMH00_17500 [Candidatus Limnocylindrales bacterium]|nr:hypothetical protein [Candidatus Limnocylindrales bacterium]
MAEAERHLPVRPNLEQLKHQAKDLLRAIREGDRDAIAGLQRNHPERIDPSEAKLADAQLALARSYGVASWPRLVTACRMIDAIWRDDAETIREMVLREPRLVHENARATEKCNWGPPMSYAANLGRDKIIEMLRGLGAMDVMRAFDRAVLQSKIETARRLYEMAGRPPIPQNVLANAAYTLSATGTALLFELGARVYDEEGKRLAPVDVVLGTDSRRPADKHAILEMYAQNGFRLPDTATMALHRGRIDLLEEHLRRDPGMLRRQFRFEEIYPPEMGCHDEILATHGTPLAGATLLHMAVDYDEMDIARWLLERGMNADEKAAVDAEGFGGHTALFATVVSQPNFWMNHLGKPKDAPFTRLLLEHGAEPNARASLRKQLHPGYGEETMHEYRDVTPIGWGERFHRKVFVSEAAMEMIRERGGRE